MPPDLRQDLDVINPLPRITDSQLSQVFNTEQTEEKVKKLTPSIFHDYVRDVFGACQNGTGYLLRNNRGLVSNSYWSVRNIVQLILDVFIMLSCSWSLLLSAVPKLIIRTDAWLNSIYGDRWSFKPKSN